MPIKRRVAKKHRHVITPKAVELYLTLLAIVARGNYEKWEDAGGDRRAFLDTNWDLHRELSLSIAGSTIFDVLDGDDPPDCMKDGNHVELWNTAVEMRRALERATKR